MMDSATSLEHILSAYLQDRRPRPATQKTLERIVRIFVADTQLNDFTQIDQAALYRWRDEVLDRASNETWNTYHRHLRLLGNYAVSSGSLAANPFKQVRSIRSGRRRKKTITKELLHEALNSNALAPAWFWTIVIRTLYFTAMRRSQLAALTWGDIHLRKGQIDLSATSSKADNDHEIPLPTQIEQDLIDLYAQAVRAKGRVQKTDQVFNVTLFNRRYKGNRMTAEQVSGFFQRLSKRLGARISAHRLRHTLATDLIELTDARTVQEQLGHSEVTTTLTFYVHPDINRMRTAIEALPGI